MPTDNDYGRDCYVYVDGKRLRTRMVRTIRPRADEENVAFEERMERLAEAVARYEDTISIALEFVRQKGRITECVIDVAQRPRPVAVLEKVA